MTKYFAKKGVSFFLSGACFFVFVTVLSFSLFSEVFAEELPSKEEVEREFQDMQTGLSHNKDSSDDFNLKQRVEELERQVGDLQIGLGTLQNLLKSGSGVQSDPLNASTGEPSSLDHRATLEELELKLRALSLKTDQLAQKINIERAQDQTKTFVQQKGSLETSAVESQMLPSEVGIIVPEVKRSDLSEQGPPKQRENNFTTQPEQDQSPKVAALDPLSAPNDPVQEYERAYGFLIQQNYESALAGFRKFIKSHPKDPLMPHALYWLGETYYAQRNYSDAAEAFDLLVQGYGNSPKAPDSLMKRGIALGALGKKADSCDVFNKLSFKYPNAAANLKERVDAERKRIGCLSPER